MINWQNVLIENPPNDATAICQSCDWDCYDDDAAHNGEDHAEKTGHKVEIELTFTVST